MTLSAAREKESGVRRWTCGTKAVHMDNQYIHYLEHPSLHKFPPVAQTYCKTRGRHQNMVNVHFFLLRAFFPKPGWSVLQDDRSLNIQKERAEINERKYPQNERKYPQTSAHLKKRNNPAFLWMEEGDLVERFSGGERFLGGRAEIGISSIFSQKKGHVGCLR